MFHTRKIKTLEYQLTLLKRDLKVTSVKLRYKNKLLERKRTKNQLNHSLKNVYHHFRGNNTTITDLQNQDDVETFWCKIWGESKESNCNAPWLSNLEKSHCTNVKPSDYTTGDTTISNTIKRL